MSRAVTKKRVGTWAVLCGACIAALFWSRPALAMPLSFRIYLVWWQGQEDQQRHETESYIDCLVNDTNYASMFDVWGGASFTFGGSVDIPENPPGDHFGICDGDWDFTNTLIAKGKADGSFPTPTAGAPIPLYVFMAPKAVRITNCANNGCQFSDSCPGICYIGNTVGLNTGDIGNTDGKHCGCFEDGKSWLIAWVNPRYCGYDGGDAAKTLSDTAATIEHEVAEAVSGALGNVNGNGGNGAIGDQCSINATLSCPSRPGVAYGSQPYDTKGFMSCSFHTQVNGSACAPDDWGCGQDADCCPGSTCSRDNGWGGKLCAPTATIAQVTGNDAVTLVNWTNDGHAEIFAKTRAGMMVHTYPNGLTDTWNMIYELDTPSTCGAAAGYWTHQGFAELYDAAPDGSPQHLWFAAGNGWTKWTHDMKAPATSLSHFSTLVWQDGHTEVLALGADGAAWHTHYQQGDPAGWAAWESLGGSFTTGASAILWGDGHGELFATDAAGLVWHSWSGSGADFPKGWHAWASIDGAIASRPIPVRWADGHVELFARGKDDHLYHSDWSASVWPAFAVLSSATTIGGEPSAIMNGSNQGAAAGPEVFARDAQGKVVHLWIDKGVYTDFTPLADQASASDPFGWIRADGKAEVFAIDAAGALTRTLHDGANGWSPWSVIGGVDLDPCVPPPTSASSSSTGSSSSSASSSTSSGVVTTGAGGAGDVAQAKSGCSCALENQDAESRAVEVIVVLGAALLGRRRRRA